MSIEPFPSIKIIINVPYYTYLTLNFPQSCTVWIILLTEASLSRFSWILFFISATRFLVGNTCALSLTVSLSSSLVMAFNLSRCRIFTAIKCALTSSSGTPLGLLQIRTKIRYWKTLDWNYSRTFRPAILISISCLSIGENCSYSE